MSRDGDYVYPFGGTIKGGGDVSRMKGPDLKGGLSTRTGITLIKD